MHDIQPIAVQPIAVDELVAASITGVSVSSLQKMRVRGDGPRYAKIGNRVRYRISDLEAFVANSLIGSTSAGAPLSICGLGVTHERP